MWRHLDSCQYQTHLHVRIPRVDCSQHGVVQVTVPWTKPRARFTRLFERLALDVLRQCDGTGATKIARISWDEAWGILTRAVKRGQQRKTAKVVRTIGVDEKAVAKGHRYLTMVCYLEEGTVEHIAERSKGSPRTEREWISQSGHEPSRTYVCHRGTQKSPTPPKLQLIRFFLST